MDSCKVVKSNQNPPSLEGYEMTSNLEDPKSFVSTLRRDGVFVLGSWANRSV